MSCAVIDSCVRTLQSGKWAAPLRKTMLLPEAEQEVMLGRQDQKMSIWILTPQALKHSLWTEESDYFGSPGRQRWNPEQTSRTLQSFEQWSSPQMSCLLYYLSSSLIPKWKMNESRPQDSGGGMKHHGMLKTWGTITDSFQESFPLLSSYKLNNPPPKQTNLILFQFFSLFIKVQNLLRACIFHLVVLQQTRWKNIGYFYWIMQFFILISGTFLK